jgi:hypothetical protein
MSGAANRPQLSKFQQLVQDDKLTKLATHSEALTALGTLADPSKSNVEKVQASLSLAKAAGDALKPEDLKGFLGTALNGLPAAEKLIGAVAAWADPTRSGIDKAKATLELAQAVKESVGNEFPKLANDLRKLDGSMRAVGAAITLLDPNASAGDKALAAAQLAAWKDNLTEGGKDVLIALKDLATLGGDLAESAVGYLGDMAKDGIKAAGEALKGLADLPGKVGELASGAFNAIKDVINDGFDVGPVHIDPTPWSW